jgi:hypothetical protein
VTPVNGGEIQYYHEAIKIDNVFVFLREYNMIQESLSQHSKIHPPGATLFYFLLYKLFVYPFIISIIIMLISLVSIFYLYFYLKRKYDKKWAIFGTLLFIFIPSVQIYFLSSLDAAICFSFIGLLYHFHYWKNKKIDYHAVLSICYLLFISLLTYLVIIIYLLLLVYMIRRKHYFKILILITILIVFYIIFLFIFNFNYISGFLTAFNTEKLILSSPSSYIFTRLEAIAEFIFFLGPLLSFLCYKSLKVKKKNENELLKYIFIIVLIFFILGAYRTGETARGLLFIYPLILIAIVNYLHNKENIVAHMKKKSIIISNRYNYTLSLKKKLLIISWIQCILMHLFGFYFW